MASSIFFTNFDDKGASLRANQGAGRMEKPNLKVNLSTFILPFYSTLLYYPFLILCVTRWTFNFWKTLFLQHIDNRYLMYLGGLSIAEALLTSHFLRTYPSVPFKHRACLIFIRSLLRLLISCTFSFTFSLFSFLLFFSLFSFLSETHHVTQCQMTQVHQAGSDFVLQQVAHV